MDQIEPYMLNIALEVLKILGGVLIPALTIFVTIYAKKWQRNQIRKDVRNEIRYVTQISTDTFKLMSFELKKETTLQHLYKFLADEGYNISEPELELMVERELSAPKRLERLALSISNK